MPVCGYSGCHIQLGSADDHAFCFGHRECSLRAPCPVCELWPVSQGNLLLTEYNNQLAQGQRVFHYFPPSATAPWPHVTPPAAPPCSPHADTVSAAPDALPGPSSCVTPPPLRPRGRASLHESWQRHFSTNPGLPAAAAPPSSPPPSCPSLASPQPPLHARLAYWDDTIRVYGRSTQPIEPDPAPTVPWSSAPILPPVLPRGSHAACLSDAPRDPTSAAGEDPDVLLLSPDEQLNSSPPRPVLEPVSPYRSSHSDSPFPGFSWPEVEARAVHLVAEVLPNELVAAPPTSHRHFASCPPPSAPRHAFLLAPVVEREFEALQRFVTGTAERVPTGIFSVSRPTQWRHQWWVAADQFALAYPAIDPDASLIRRTPPTSISMPLRDFHRMARLHRGLILCLNEIALMQEAAFLASANLPSLRDEALATFSENLRMALATSSRRVSMGLQMATRAVGSDFLLHRDAFLAGSHLSAARLLSLRALSMRSDALFNHALPQLRLALTPSIPAPLPAIAWSNPPPHSASASSALVRRRSSSARPPTSHPSRRNPSRGRGRANGFHNNNNSYNNKPSSSLPRK